MSVLTSFSKIKINIYNKVFIKFIFWFSSYDSINTTTATEIGSFSFTVNPRQSSSKLFSLAINLKINCTETFSFLEISFKL